MRRPNNHYPLHGSFSAPLSFQGRGAEGKPLRAADGRAQRSCYLSPSIRESVGSCKWTLSTEKKKKILACHFGFGWVSVLYNTHSPCDGTVRPQRNEFLPAAWGYLDLLWVNGRRRVSDLLWCKMLILRRVTCCLLWVPLLIPLRLKGCFSVDSFVFCTIQQLYIKSSSFLGLGFG